MPAARQKHRPLAPFRSLFSDLPDPPGVYCSTQRLAERWCYYALGTEAKVLQVVRPGDYETDAEVVARLVAEGMSQAEPRPPLLALVNADTLTAYGFDPSIHRPLSLPRLVRAQP